MIFRTPIETSRLLLEQESLLDFERFYGMSVDLEVMKYIGDGSVFHWTKEVALEKFKDALSRQDHHAFGNLAVYRREGHQYIGWCGVSYSRFLDHMELGHRYCRDSWGEGYATEAASAILTETYEVSDLDDILACVHPDNAASIRVLEKLGFRFSHSRLSKPIGRDMPVYRIDIEARGKTTMAWRVYLLRCADDSLYCGISKDLETRIAQHNAGKGAKYTRSRLPVKLVAAGGQLSRSDALKVEHAVKQQPASRKADALNGRIDLQGEE